MKKHRILAVDDHEMNRLILEELLGESFEFQAVSDGETALQVIEQFKPDLILLDVMMPGIDGYETCRRLREKSKKQAKIIMVSARAQTAERLAGYHAGADDYIVKPFDVDELMAKIRVYLRLKSCEEVIDTKRKMLDVLRHGNRAPLTNILMNAELLGEPQELDLEARQSIASCILNNAQRLFDWLEKGELLACLLTDSQEFFLQKTDMVQIVQDSIKDLTASNGKKRSTFKIKAPQSAIVQADREQMRLAVDSLISWAIRNSNDAAIVRIKIQKHGDETRLSVMDSGQQGTPENLTSMFEPFSDPESVLRNDCDGLSLAIARQIVMKHGGMIDAQQSEKQGITYSITLSSSGLTASSQAFAEELSACPESIVQSANVG